VTRSQLLLPYPQFTGVNVINMTMANSLYHSMQVKMDKRFSSGIGVLVAYTFGKLISDSNNTVSNNGGAVNNSTGTQNWYNLRAERSLSEMDVTHAIVISFVGELPFGPGKKFLANTKGIASHLVGGWQINGITSDRSGFPLAMSATIVGGGNRPNSTGQSAAIDGSRTRGQQLNQWFNTSAFTQPPSYSYGNVSRTLPDVRGPGLFNLDLSLIKNMKLSEKAHLQLRFEYFNAFNHPNFDLPNTGMGSGAFGRISSTVLLPRVGQVAMKVNF